MMIRIQRNTLGQGREVIQRSAFLVVSKLTENELSMLADLNPSFVAFAGVHSEAIHDMFDKIAASRGLKVITTWHEEESQVQMLAEFAQVYMPLNSQSGIGYVLQEE